MKLIRQARRPNEAAVRQPDGSWLVEDDVDGTPMGRNAVPKRNDLPRGHPMRGKRVVSYVEAGQPSLVMGEDGVLRPDSPEADPEVVELEPAVIRNWWE